MVIIREGGAHKKKEKKDTWYWRCPECHTIGLHEDGDSYTEGGSEWNPFERDIKMWFGFKCPVCGHSIQDNKPFNRLIARIIAFVNETIEPRILESICIMVNVLYGRKAKKNPANRNRFKKKVNVTIKAE